MVPESLDLLHNNLHDYNDPGLIVAADVIAEMGEAHAGLQDVPEDVTGPPVIRVAKTEFAASVLAAADGGKQKGEEKEVKRQRLLECLVMWGQFIIMRYKQRKDPTVLANNGFELKKPRAKRTTSKEPTPVPSDVRVRHGASETLVINAKQIPGNGTFEVRYTTTPNDESSWIDGGHHIYCQIELKGFVPGTRYYISLRYHGKNGTSAWSTPVSIIAL